MAASQSFPQQASEADAPAVAAGHERPVPVACRDIVAIGASAGGVRVLLQLAAALPTPLPAALLVVLHVGTHRSLLPELMGARGDNPVLHPADGQPVQPGTIYVAPPDHHMLVASGAIRLQRGPKENHARPAIDPLFRSVALEYGPRAIGVVLSGRLDDGTAGLQAIRQCGGLAVVQDPDDAEQPDMPASALAHVAVDHCVPASRLADTLMALVEQPVIAVAPAVPASLASEQAISIGADDPMQHLNAIGTRSRFACPDCNGVLWELNGSRPKRYRCHTGHGFTLRGLAHTQAESTDEALWSALRALQEREALLRELAVAGTGPEGDGAAAGTQAEAERTAQHVEILRRLLVAD